MPRRYDDEDDPPTRRRRRRRRKPPSNVSTIAIAGTVVGVVVVVALIAVLSGGPRGGGGHGPGLGGDLHLGGGLFGAAISYEQFKAINGGDTLDGLEQRFGKATRIDRADWGRAELRTGGFTGDRTAPRTLAAYTQGTDGIEVWYRWRSGNEDLYVATGTRDDGRRGLVAKGYTNAAAKQLNAGRVDPNHIDVSKLFPAFEFLPVD